MTSAFSGALETPMLEVRGLSKSYQSGDIRVDALSDVTLSVMPGSLTV